MASILLSLYIPQLHIHINVRILSSHPHQQRRSRRTTRRTGDSTKLFRRQIALLDIGETHVAKGMNERKLSSTAESLTFTLRLRQYRAALVAYISRRSKVHCHSKLWPAVALLNRSQTIRPWNQNSLLSIRGAIFDEPVLVTPEFVSKTWQNMRIRTNGIRWMRSAAWIPTITTF